MSDLAVVVVTHDSAADVEACVGSVLAHAGAARVHYLHSPGLPDATAARIRAMVERSGGTISFHRIERDAVAGFPSEHRFTPAMWYRLFLPELLSGVDRVLYLDSDTIVTDYLGELWATDLSEHWVAAVTNVFEPWSEHRPAELGLPGPAAYFNSGVLLFNLAAMRRDGRGEALRELVRTRGAELLWPDQDVLNLVLGERRVALHPRWNCMNSILSFPAAREVFGATAVEEARRRPGVRHFEGPGANKPWHLLCDTPGRRAYFVHRRATPWPRTRREGVTALNALRRVVHAVRP